MGTRKWAVQFEIANKRVGRSLRREERAPESDTTSLLLMCVLLNPLICEEIETDIEIEIESDIESIF